MKKLDLQKQPINLDLVFTCGQAFRWQKADGDIWRGIVRDKLMELKIEDGCLLWRTYPEDDELLVHDYLRLGDDVNEIYAKLAESDPHLKELISQFHGIRFLRQDPTETLLTFICSAANSIPRITASVAAISALYGRLICEHEGSCYHAFPAAQVLAELDPDLLAKTEGLGFRGGNIKKVAEQVLERGDGWLASLRGIHYEKAREQLLAIKGVGKKIADCVCLFALDKDEAVPVDTHVKQLAQIHWLPDLKAKSITDNVYNTIVNEFKQRYGKYAGWAQQFLYYEDLLRTRSMGRGLR